MTSARIKWLDLCDYQEVYRMQQAFTNNRGKDTDDEIWSLEHQPVYTLGLSGKIEHVINAGDIPLVNSDRGGQVTYHGPGQLIVYLLLDLKRMGIPVKRYVYKLEQAVIDMLIQLGMHAERRIGAPGVYISNRKIAALGVRIRKGCCYHGISLNVDMEMAPFRGINPCGYEGLEVTQLSDFDISMTTEEVNNRLLPFLFDHLGIVNINTNGRQEFPRDESEQLI